MRHNTKVRPGHTEPNESAADQGEDDKDSGVDEQEEARAGTERPRKGGGSKRTNDPKND